MLEHEYRVVRDGGRVKSAGVSFDVMVDPALDFIKEVSIATAVSTTQHYANLRKGPTEELRNRSFPRNPANRDRFRNGAYLTRPTLKTDQGAGLFTAFTEGSKDKDNLMYHIEKEVGFAIVESYFSDQLKSVGYPQTVMAAIHEVQNRFAENDLREAQLAYEQLIEVAGQSGINGTRKAQVGRDALFFIHPAIPIKNIQLPYSVVNGVELEINLTMATAVEMARRARRNFAQRHNLPDAQAPIYMPPYMQADMQIMRDGKILLDQLQLPDVGLFLVSLDVLDNSALADVKRVMEPIVEETIDAISETVSNRIKPMFLITRPEVIESQEDSLEIREIAVLQEKLQERGIKTQVISVDYASELTKHDTALLLNVDILGPGFERLLRQRVSETQPARIFPDPFLKLIQSDLTKYRQKKLTVQTITNLKAICKGDIGSQPEAVFTKMLAVDSFLSRIGIGTEVFHVYVSSQKTPIACYRYDLRGIQIALNYIQEGDTVTIREIPIAYSNAVLFKEGRPLYSVFRFMAVRGEI